MNEESLSALLDGECSPAELDRLLDDLGRNPALREQYSRMCLARASRQGTRVRSAQLDFSTRVLAGLDPAPASAVTSLRSRRALPWRPVAGLAAAAAFGAAAVLVLRPETALSPTMPAATPVAAYVADVADPTADGQLTRLDDENAGQLRNYLIAYSQSRAQQGMGGTLGYARFAAYTDYRPQDRDR